MGWNTQKLQLVVDQRIRYGERIDTKQLAHIDPVATRHINLRGVLQFPVTEYAEALFMKRAPVKRAA